MRFVAWVLGLELAFFAGWLRGHDVGIRRGIALHRRGGD